MGLYKAHRLAQGSSIKVTNKASVNKLMDSEVKDFSAFGLGSKSVVQGAMDLGFEGSEVQGLASARTNVQAQKISCDGYTSFARGPFDFVFCLQGGLTSGL